MSDVKLVCAYCGRDEQTIAAANAYCNQCHNVPALKPEVNYTVVPEKTVPDLPRPNIATASAHIVPSDPGAVYLEVNASAHRLTFARARSLGMQLLRMSDQAETEEQTAGGVQGEAQQAD